MKNPNIRISELPDWADAITLKAMAKDPAARYQSALTTTAAGLPVRVICVGSCARRARSTISPS